MKFSLDDSDGRLAITGYGPGEIRVGARRFTANLLITPDGVVEDWGPATVAELSPSHLLGLLEHRPELLELGTGQTQDFPDLRLFADLMDAGVGYEIMDTAAACRTYNILLGEGRRVVAALML